MKPFSVGYFKMNVIDARKKEINNEQVKNQITKTTEVNMDDSNANVEIRDCISKHIAQVIPKEMAKEFLPCSYININKLKVSCPTTITI